MNSIALSLAAAGVAGLLAGLLLVLVVTRKGWGWAYMKVILAIAFIAVLSGVRAWTPPGLRISALQLIAGVAGFVLVVTTADLYQKYRRAKKL